MKRQSQTSARNALIIFVILTIVFAAQMAWWIIFQVRNAETTKRILIRELVDEQEQAIRSLNNQYRSLFEAIQARANNSRDIDLVEATLFHPAISGIAFEDAVVEDSLRDSLYYIWRGQNGSVYVFLNRAYPEELLSHNDRLEYFQPSSGEIKKHEWVSKANIGIKSEAIADIDKTSASHLKMFVMEGSFFILLIFLGAYMIYSALKRIRIAREGQLLFIRSITHELKIPLTSMNLFLDTLRRRGYDSKLASELAPKMKQDLVRLNQLIDNVLQARKLSDKEIEWRPETFDLSEAIERFGVGIRDKIESSGGSLKMEIEKGVKIHADRAELIKVWDLLIENSLKYRKEGTVGIEIRLKTSKGYAELQFIDDGIGIDEDEKERLFEPFFRGRVKESRSISGTGLGLYIAAEYVRRNRGEINIGNNPLGGCIVAQRYKIHK
jgi:signal transduction histidine kinase